MHLVVGGLGLKLFLSCIIFKLRFTDRRSLRKAEAGYKTMYLNLGAV